MSNEWAEDFRALTAKTHTEQAIWWLNGFWKKGASEYAETIWNITHQFLALDLGKPLLYGGKMPEFKESSDLDELNSHRVLEALGETMTVVALRKRLQALDIDNNKRMAISEYLIDKYKKTPLELVRSPQGDVDPVLLAAATKACDEAGAALDQASADAEAAAAALQASRTAAAEAARAKEAADARAKEAAAALKAAQEAEATVRAAEAELQAAVDEITKLEEAKRQKISAAQAIIDDPKTSAMKRGVAVQERDSTLAEDPLPLRKAKITQQAALKKVEKARKIAEEETAKAAAAKRASDEAAAEAAHAKHAADEAAEAAAHAKERADEAKREAQRALEAAEKALNDLKAKGTEPPMGKLWWMDRVLKEKKKYMK